jgi:hypothetical protein
MNDLKFQHLLMMSGKVLKSLDALSWKVLFSMGTISLVELDERISLVETCSSNFR